MKTLKFWPVFVLFFFCVGSWLMLYPASLMLIPGGKSGFVQGAHVDTIPLPFLYEWVQRLVRAFSPELLNGAIFSEQMGAPFGHSAWVSFLERAVIALFGWFWSPEQLTSGVPWACLVLNGICATFVARRFGLSRTLSLACGVVLAWNPFTHWRASMHYVLAGLYVFPLLWLGFLGIRDAKRPLQAFLSGFWIVPTLSASPYFAIIAITLMPGLGLWALAGRWRRIPWVVLGLVPFGAAALWFQLKSPIPSRAAVTEPPRYSQARAPGSLSSWDVLVYSARPMSYIAGSTDPSFKDPIWPRRWVTEKLIEKERLNFYPQEQANGIRWTVLLLLFGALLFWVRRLETDDRKMWLWLFGITAFAYWCSLSPRSISPLGIGIGPSRWIHAVFPEVRAPNRWGAAVIWGLTLAAFLALEWRLKASRLTMRVRSGVRLAVLLLVVIEFPPTFSMPLTPETPRAGLPERGCGLGVFVPYNTSDSDQTYRVLASLRGTDCRVLNHQSFPLDDIVLRHRLGSFTDPHHARPILECLDVQWLMRSPAGLATQQVSKEAFLDYCLSLGGESQGDGRCQLARSTSVAPPGSRARCLNSVPWSKRP